MSTLFKHVVGFFIVIKEGEPVRACIRVVGIVLYSGEPVGADVHENVDCVVSVVGDKVVGGGGEVDVAAVGGDVWFVVGAISRLICSAAAEE